jgi:RNA polymerase sigma-70 factor, ECF subfamily
VPAIATRPDEFESFYREHLQLVRLYLARRVDDPFVAADLTAEVFLRVIHAAASYRRDLGPPRAWLIGIARNVVADHRRSSAREGAAVRRLNARRLLDEDSIERIVERISAEADVRKLLASIADLPDSLRSVVELVAVDRLSVAEAAGVLGIRPGAARVRYHRARRMLRDSFRFQAQEVIP